MTHKSAGPGNVATALANGHLATEISWANRENFRNTHTPTHNHRQTNTHTLTHNHRQTSTPTDTQPHTHTHTSTDRHTHTDT